MKMVSRKIIILMLILIILVSSVNAVGYTHEYTVDELKELIAYNQQIQQDAHALAEIARSFGWDENSEAILKAQEEYAQARAEIEKYQKMLKELMEDVWVQRSLEYPEATEIWLYMKELGWNDYVCAGIMGNIMAEVGGGTLNLQVCANTGNGFYGMCQWSKTYCSDVWGADLEGQCDYLKDTIQYEMDTFGYAYSYGFNYESFLKLENEQDVAYAFAVCYERCATEHRWIRRSYATKAYEYFVEE